jgi:hypothetical protein
MYPNTNINILFFEMHIGMVELENYFSPNHYNKWDAE